MFWQEFASTKKKKIAAERIGHVISRELHLRELQAQYVERATALAQVRRTPHRTAPKPGARRAPARVYACTHAHGPSTR